MATKKAVKVRDMKPKKDAKGGGKGHAVNTTKPQGTGVNRHGHGHNNN